MKRRVFCLLCALALAAGLAGCAPEVPPESPSPSPEEALSVDLVQAPADLAPLTLCRTAAIPGGPAAELGLSSVALYTSARRGEDGAFEWDDGQSFSLIVAAEDGYYPLISDLYLQFGAVDYLIFSEEEGGVFHVLVQITEGVGVQILDYRYDAETRRFVGTAVYEAGPLAWVQAPLEPEGGQARGDFFRAYRQELPPAPWEGGTSADFEGRSFLLEDPPENAAETAAVNSYYCPMAGEFDALAALAGEDTRLAAAYENEREQSADGVFFREVTVHRVSLLSEADFSAPGDYFAAPAVAARFLDALANDVSEYGLTEYTVAYLDLSWKWSERALERGPQLGDGRYERLFLLGKTDEEAPWLVYELYWGEYALNRLA